MNRIAAEVFKKGLISGAIGYVLVSVYYALLNLLIGRSPFATLQAIGHAFFHAGTAGVGEMLAYNGVHLVAWLALGCIAALLVEEAELHPSFWFVMYFVLLAGFIFSDAFLVLVVGAAAGLSPASILIGNVTALAGMGIYLYRAHPGLPALIAKEAE